MRILPLLLLPFLATPVQAKRIGPGVQMEVDATSNDAVRVVVRNSGDSRGRYQLEIIDPVTRQVISEGTVKPNTLNLSPNRGRKVRFLNLPNRELLLCASVNVSPSLDLRSCVRYLPR